MGTIARRARRALVAVTMVGALGVAQDASAATREWHNMVDPTHSLPVNVRGTACTAPFTVSRTKWNTIIGCNPYFTSTGTVAMHWSFLRIDVNSGDLCTSDGWLYPASSLTRTYMGNCAGIHGPRVPWPPIT